MLGHIHMEEGNSQKALAILDSACNVSPKSLARHRSIAGIAEDAGDLRRVEKALSIVVKQTRNSPLRNSSDYAKLGNALSELGETKKAVELLTEAKNSFREAADTRLLAAVEAVAQHKAGNTERALQALAKALQGDATLLPEATALAVAKACLINAKQDQATAILRHVVQNNPDATAVHARVANILKQHGGEEASQRFIESSVREVIDLNNEAVAKAKTGEFAVASRMLLDAAARLPNNLQIVANASYCLLLDVVQNGFDEDKMHQALLLQQSVQGQDSNHAKLADIEDVLAMIRSKYGAQEAI